MSGPLSGLLVSVRAGWAHVDNRPLAGLPVAVWGGGPGLTEEVRAALYPYPGILVNNAALVGPPGVAVALDQRWWGWHGKATRARHACFTTAVNTEAAIPGVYTMRKARDVCLSPDRDALGGKNSGHAAVNLAVHLGASRVYLAGFDMTFRDGRSHWHEGHNIPASQHNYETRFRPELADLVRAAAERGVIVSAITPSSAPIPHTPLETALKDMADAAQRMDHAQA